MVVARFWFVIVHDHSVSPNLIIKMSRMTCCELAACIPIRLGIAPVNL